MFSCIDIHFNINPKNKYIFALFPLCQFPNYTIWPQYLTILYSYLALCSLDCGQHGQCQGSGCVCQEGWEGKRCQHRSCDARCSMHGQCKNGSCICQTGFNGKHCSLQACNPSGFNQGSLCSGHGTCESTLTRDGINNNRGNKRTVEDTQYVKEMTNLFTSTDFNGPDYRYAIDQNETIMVYFLTLFFKL